MFSPPPSQNHSLSRLGTPHRASPFSQSRNVSVPSSRAQSAAPRENMNEVGVRAGSSSSTGINATGADNHAAGTLLMDTYAKFAEIEASFFAYLPPELHALRNSDFYHEEYSAVVDPDTSHAILISPATAYVWKYTLTAPSTSYIFPCPTRKNSTYTQSSLGACVPFDGREPGLLLISVTGEVRFWESVLSGLSGAENFHTHQVSFQENQSVTAFVRCNPSYYIITATHSPPIRLKLTSSSGSWRLISAPFHNTISTISRMSSFFSASETVAPETTVVAIAFSSFKGPRTSVWVLLDYGLQHWEVSEDGYEKLLSFERQIIDLVANGLTTFVYSEVRELEIELMDIVNIKSGDLVILFSYATPGNLDGPAPRLHALAKLAMVSEKVSVTQIQTIPYTNKPEMGMTSPCRVIILRDRFAVIHFGDALVLLTMNGQYSAILPLKSPLDRFLAIARQSYRSATLEQIVAVTATGILEVRINMESISQGDPHLREVNLLKDTMTQAILYGALSHNPLQFRFPSHVDDESLNESALQLSQAVLRSNSELGIHAPAATLDMQKHLNERLDRLHLLIDFISVNGAKSKLSLESRTILENDAEKMFAAVQLWQWFNHHAVTQQRSVLVDAVTSYMQSAGLADENDLVRSFFSCQIQNLPKVLPHVIEVFRMHDYDALNKKTQVLSETNDIVITVVRESFRHRRDYEAVYDIKTPAMQVSAWTADLSVINSLTELFKLTVAILQERKRQHGASSDSNNNNPFTSVNHDQILVSQLGDLARFIFSCNRQRQAWLQSNNDSESRQYVDQVRNQQTDLLQSLVQQGVEDTAFDLAEDYGDFRNLAHLCQDCRQPSPERTKRYIDRYGEAFTLELFAQYFESANAKMLFHQDDRHSPLVDRFFEESPAPRLSWIQDINGHRYSEASEALIHASSPERSLAVKQSILSIGLLNQYVSESHASEGRRTTNDVLSVDDFHNELEYISVQKTIKDEFDNLLVEIANHRHLSVDRKLAVIVQDLFTSMESRPIMLTLLTETARHIVQGDSVSHQELIELICSRDRVQDGADFATAIKLLDWTSNMSQYTKDLLLRTVWRKLFIHDDWHQLTQTGQLSDTQLNNNIRRTALYKTLRATAHSSNVVRLTPSQASVVPLPQDIERRWPGLTSDQHQALVNDYEWERDRLQESAVQMVYEQVVCLERDDRPEPTMA